MVLHNVKYYISDIIFTRIVYFLGKNFGVLLQKWYMYLKRVSRRSFSSITKAKVHSYVESKISKISHLKLYLLDCRICCEEFWGSNIKNTYFKRFLRISFIFPTFPKEFEMFKFLKNILMGIRDFYWGEFWGGGMLWKLFTSNDSREYLSIL